MTAGSGITHSEYNASADEAVHLLQLWIIPERSGTPPGYEQAIELWGTILSVDLRVMQPVLDQAQGVVDSARPQVERGISKAQQQAQRITRMGSGSAPGPASN